jgi:hypothetical protein
MRSVDFAGSMRAAALLGTSTCEQVTLISFSWNTGTTFLSDALTQDSWWRLIVYFDVLGMAVTRGAVFDAFFASPDVNAFAAVLLVPSC